MAFCVPSLGNAASAPDPAALGLDPRRRGVKVESVELETGVGGGGVAKMEGEEGGGFDFLTPAEDGEAGETVLS